VFFAFGQVLQERDFLDDELLATGLAESGWARAFGFIAVMLAAVNIFGGFVVTQRMLSMFKKKG
jgi:NAD(P) transhydrogenase subunit alpha